MASLSPGDALPMDPRVVRGALPNGMAFYVMANGEPRNRAELAVVIKSGSVHEAEHERGRIQPKPTKQPSRGGAAPANRGVVG